eukprot:GHVU01229057.1.p1 GENE.GHVU01229057.1~~GHVU01229057.1.p1  ORF type:complete len:150 (-),score=22.02 GHVU01229057.1:513-962(-)
MQIIRTLFSPLFVPLFFHLSPPHFPSFIELTVEGGEGGGGATGAGARGECRGRSSGGRRRRNQGGETRPRQDNRRDAAGEYAAGRGWPGQRRWELPGSEGKARDEEGMKRQQKGRLVHKDHAGISSLGGHPLPSVLFGPSRRLFLRAAV